MSRILNFKQTCSFGQRYFVTDDAHKHKFPRISRETITALILRRKVLNLINFEFVTNFLSVLKMAVCQLPNKEKRQKNAEITKLCWFS